MQISEEWKKPKKKKKKNETCLLNLLRITRKIFPHPAPTHLTPKVAVLYHLQFLLYVLLENVIAKTEKLESNNLIIRHVNFMPIQYILATIFCG